MNVAGFLRWALTKPVIIVFVLVCAVAGGAQGYRSTTSHFETTAAVLVIPPGAGSHNAVDNPFTNLSTATAQMAYVLITAAHSDAGRSAVEQAGASPDVTMGSVAGEGSFAQLSPQITFTVTGPDQWASKAGAEAMITFIRERLDRMQKEAGVVQGFADLRVSIAPTPGVEVGGDGTRAAVGLAMGSALGALLLSLVAAAGLESFRQNRARRRADGTHEPDNEAATEPPAESATAESAPAPTAPIKVPTSPAATSDGASEPDELPLSGLARTPGGATRRAMTRWRSSVEEVQAETEFPLPTFDDAASTSGADAPGDADTSEVDPSEVDPPRASSAR